MKNREEIKRLMSQLHNLYSSESGIEQAYEMLERFQRDCVLGAGNNPIFRFTFLRGKNPKAFFGFWDSGSLCYSRVFWKLYRVSATVDCSTTGGSLYCVDPCITGKV